MLKSQYFTGLSRFHPSLKVAALRFVAPLSFLFAFTSVVLFSCTKIEYTTLGTDLVPPVNNITTFDTTLDVTTENFIQTGDDTLKPYYYDQLVTGQIKNDPLFGTTSGAIYLEMKPPSFPATATAKNFVDSSLIGIGENAYDSTVLAIKYDGGYGDTMQNINFEIYLLGDTLTRLSEKSYPLKVDVNATFLTKPMTLVGRKSVSLHSLYYDSVQITRSSTLSYKKTRELRIRLMNDQFWKDLLKDTTAAGAMADEVKFRDKFKGFAIRAVPANSAVGSLAYFTISDTATRLQFYYRRKNAGLIDTTSTSFAFNPNNSGFANNVVWDRGSSEITRHLTSTDSLIYIKTNPGTQVRIRIPGLENLSNRIINRAELRTYIIPNNLATDGLLSPPPTMYLERYDTTTANTYLPIPIDLNPSELYGNCFPVTNGISYGYFGGYPRSDSSGPPFQGRFYGFNISRYVQQIVTHQLRNSPLRLTANLYSQYTNCSGGAPLRVTNNIIGYGRAKLGGGGLKGTLAPYKMRLRIIYTRI